MPTPRPERRAALVSSQRPSGQFNGLVEEAEGKEVKAKQNNSKLNYCQLLIKKQICLENF